jgi:predicted NBD/HSP70 family sugar kinase
MSRGDTPARTRFFADVGVKSTAFGDAGASIGAKVKSPGLRFFDASDRRLAFGPGAGLVLGVSLGSGSARAALVDANGVLHHERGLDAWPGQLHATPSELLDRIREVAGASLRLALDDPELLVSGCLPFLGVAVAWPTAVDRDKRAIGSALSHHSWRSGRNLTERVANHLHLPDERSHALNDAHSAAIAVAFDHTRAAAHRKQKHPHLTIVVRVAGGIGAASIIIEEPTDARGEAGQTSGFPSSILLGGYNNAAGELGHIRVGDALVQRLNADRPKGLGKLAPFHCSCVDPAAQVPKHLEAYAAAPAVAHRVAPGEPMAEVLDGVMKDPENPVHRRALDDVGVLVGEALLGPTAMLNPGAIVLTGALAPEIVKLVDLQIVEAQHPMHSHPTVRGLGEAENEYIRVKGAALAVLRQHVHRQLPTILRPPKESLSQKVKELTMPLTELPWK